MLQPSTGRSLTSRVSIDAVCMEHLYTAHLNDPSRPNAFFVAFTPKFELAFGYRWKASDFPWLGIWEENRSREQSPWNRQSVTRGMEFGVSHFPRNTASDDRSRLDVRSPDLPMDSRFHNDRRRLPGCRA